MAGVPRVSTARDGRRPRPAPEPVEPDNRERPSPPFTVSPPERRACSPHGYRRGEHDEDMSDFLVITEIVVFVALVLGLIWGLDRI